MGASIELSKSSRQETEMKRRHSETELMQFRLSRRGQMVGRNALPRAGAAYLRSLAVLVLFLPSASESFVRGTYSILFVVMLPQARGQEHYYVFGNGLGFARSRLSSLSLIGCF